MITSFQKYERKSDIFHIFVFCDEEGGRVYCSGFLGEGNAGGRVMRQNVLMLRFPHGDEAGTVHGRGDIFLQQR